MLIHDVHFQVELGETAHVERRAAELGEGASERPGCEVTVWKAIAGAPLGSFVMSRPLTSMEALVGASSAIDVSLQRLLASGSPAPGGRSRTCLDKVIATNGRVRSPKLMTVTRAVVAHGQDVAAAEWGADALHHLVPRAGVTGVLTSAVAGVTSGMSWRFGVDSGDALDEMADRLDADATWLEMLESAEDLFVPGASTRLIVARL